MQLKAILCCLLLFLGSLQEVVTARRRVVGSTGPTPTLVSTNGALGFSTPLTQSLGTLNVNDTVWYHMATNSSSATLTPSVTGSCASTGGDSNIAGPVTTAGTTVREGNLKLTTGGACTLSMAFTGAGSATFTWGVIRGTSGIDVSTSSLNVQANAGNGANAITSGTAITTTGSNRLCIAGTVDANIQADTLSAGTSPISWTVGTGNSSYATLPESAAVTSAGSVQATFTSNKTTGNFMVTGLACYKP